MGIGPMIRHRLGRFEVPAADLYRNRFINLDDLAATLASVTNAERILEVGCGDGSLSQRLCAAFPAAEYVGIDISPNPGRLFQGDRKRTTFRSIPLSDYIEEGPQLFDLVVIVDVVHHLPEALRVPILQDIAKVTTQDGIVAVKDWERGKGLAHVMAFTADRYLSGDKTVRFPSRAELRGFIDAGLPEFEIICETRIPPRRNNVLYALRRP